MNENGSWHVRSAAEVLEEMGVDAARGLSPGQITAAREKFGLNRMEARGKKSPLVLFLEQFNQPLVYILLAAAVGTAVLREWVDMGVILGVVVVNAITGFVQEIRAVKAIDALPARYRDAVAPALNRVIECSTRRRRILNLVQEALSQLRLDMKYLIFDLEATRRERDEFKDLLEKDGRL